MSFDAGFRSGRGRGPYIASGTSITRNGITAAAQNANQVWSCVFNPNGQNITSFELRSGDQWSGDGASKNRSEFATSSPIFAFDTDYWIAESFNVCISDTTDTNHAVISQAHASPDGGDIDASPPLEISFRPSDGQFRITTYTSTQDPLLVNGTATIQYFTTLTRFTWHNIVHRVKFNTAGSALLQTWLNGTQVIDATGSIGYVDAVGPYWKWGYYRTAAAYTGTVKHANVEVGTTSLSGRVASPLTVTEG